MAERAMVYILIRIIQIPYITMWTISSYNTHENQLEDLLEQNMTGLKLVQDYSATLQINRIKLTPLQVTTQDKLAYRNNLARVELHSGTNSVEMEWY
jgi:hypothetical protein